jgi:ABC-type protease/lipase transport system fused ATPase/permease subunit
MLGTTRANDNLSRGKVKHYFEGSNLASMEEVNQDIASVRVSPVDDVINRMQQGYQTFPGKRCTRLSEGQRQAIANA